MSGQDPISDEPFQSSGQCLWAYPFQCLLELAEAFRADEQLSNDQRRPSSIEGSEESCDRAGGVGLVDRTPEKSDDGMLLGVGLDHLDLLSAR